MLTVDMIGEGGGGCYLTNLWLYIRIGSQFSKGRQWCSEPAFVFVFQKEACVRPRGIKGVPCIECLAQAIKGSVNPSIYVKRIHVFSTTPAQTGPGGLQKMKPVQHHSNNNKIKLAKLFRQLVTYLLTLPQIQLLAHAFHPVRIFGCLFEHLPPPVLGNRFFCFGRTKGWLARFLGALTACLRKLAGWPMVHP